MGDSADDIITTLVINEESSSYDEVKAAFNSYYAARRNIIVERARSNRRKQHPGEPIETFIQDLHCLAENCKYGTLKDELIRGRIIVGVLDDALYDRLQAKPKLTLAEAVRMSRQSEARQQNHAVVRGEQPDDVSFIKYNQPRKQGGRSQRDLPNNTSGPTQYPDKCQWCGRQWHNRAVCPAKEVSCNNCRKKRTFFCCVS